MFGKNYIRYPLDFSENDSYDVPITHDITENIGEHKLFIEFTSDNETLGRTNTVLLTVYPFDETETEIISREVYIARIEELNARIASDDNDFEAIKNAIIAENITVPNNTPTSEYANFIGQIPHSIHQYYAAIISGSFDGTFIIPEGTTKIENYAFYNTTNAFRSIVFPNTVTEIGNCAFWSCNSLTDIVIPNSVTTTGTDIFRSCSNLSSAVISNSMNYINTRAFSDCSSLQSVTIPNSVTSIESEAFARCASLANITLPSSLRTIGESAFNRCSISSIIIPNTVISIWSFAFQFCQALENLTIPNSIQNLGREVFYFCSALSNVVIENGFNADGLNLSASTLYTASTIVSWLNALADRTGRTAYTLTIGSTNLNKLTSAQIAIATNKNWNVV